mmetsp:Transcript_30311/g.96718  ORF Transcript_30311/g.96718 Transcript_30311/m.96718 type:complete len:233 (+) Transcript_30311:996-1694(+)|eukprot:scaffold11799_cov129-Isochrysis_galbana.AAC.2
MRCCDLVWGEDAGGVVHRQVDAAVQGTVTRTGDSVGVCQRPAEGAPSRAGPMDAVGGRALRAPPPHVGCRRRIDAWRDHCGLLGCGRCLVNRAGLIAHQHAHLCVAAPPRRVRPPVAGAAVRRRPSVRHTRHDEADAGAARHRRQTTGLVWFVVPAAIRLIHRRGPKPRVPTPSELRRAPQVATSSGEVRLQPAPTLTPTLHVLRRRGPQPWYRDARPLGIRRNCASRLTGP